MRAYVSDGGDADDDLVAQFNEIGATQIRIGNRGFKIIFRGF